MKKLLAYCRYGSSAASTRQRIDQYIPFLNKLGITVEKRPLFGDEYFNDIQSRSRRPFVPVARGYLRRLGELLGSTDADAIMVLDELFPFLPFALERLVYRQKKPLLFDMDDAIFNRYTTLANPLAAKILTAKFPNHFQRTAAISCGNQYLLEYSHRYCAKTVLVPTVVDTDKYKVRATPKVGPVCIGWIGSPSTWVYVIPYLELLDRIVKKYDARVVIVGAPLNQAPRKNFDFRKWSEANEISDVQEMDIGIMPLTDDEWARGKCGYKLIQYMACGVPAIASPVGVNSDIVQHGVNGRLAKTMDEWETAFDELITDVSLRQNWGEKSREHIVANYSLQVYGPIFSRLVQEIV